MASFPKLALIGLGNMGEALLGGALDAGLVNADDVTGVDAVAARSEQIGAAYGIRLAGSPGEAAAGARMILLAVKPQDAEKAVTSLGDVSGKLLVSICAGTTLASLAAWATPGVKLARVMPNTPALVGCGAAAYCVNQAATAEDCGHVEALFNAVGTVHRVADEALMDAVTGLSGSGPAYVFLFLEALADGGVKAGLPREIARELAAQTVYGAAALARKTPDQFAELREKVTSPGGTTVEGLKALGEGGFRDAVIDAVVAATARSKELGGK